MEICVTRAGGKLTVIFDDASLAGKHFAAPRFTRRYKCSRGVAFTVEKSRGRTSLYIGFDRAKDLGVLYQISLRECVEELELLWELAHLAGARFYETRVNLLDGGVGEVIDVVKFEVRTPEPGVWESVGRESAAEGIGRLERLARLRDSIPGTYGCMDPNANAVLFVDEVTEGAEWSGGIPASTRKRDPEEIADCAGCEGLFRESELTEVKPGLWICQSCRFDEGVAQAFDLGAGEVPGRLDGPGCAREEGEDTSSAIAGAARRRPTETDVNNAIQLLLWRCRDAEIHKDTPKGKRGFYGLDDWICKADDDMIRELGLWCADIQELNTGTRDS